jgi:hypothetical protein
MNSSANLAPGVAEMRADHRLQQVSISPDPRVIVRIARSLAEVEEFRAIWSSWPSHRDSDIDFCMEFGWTREEVLRPHVIVLYRVGRAEAKLVGWIERARLRSKIGYFRLPGLPARLLNFSYGGFLGNATVENCQELVQSILASLRRGEADVAILDHLVVDSPLYKQALSSSNFATRDHLLKPEPHSVMVLPNSVDELYRGFSQGLRAEVRRKRKKILADFGERVEIRCYRQPDELDGLIPRLEEIAKTTYQRGLGVGFRDTEQMRQRLRLCAQKGWLRIYILALGGKDCAFWIGTLSNHSFLSDYNAYDSKYRDYSVGTFLLAAVIEDFCTEGVKTVDFGFGQAEYKDRFANSRLTEASVFIYALSTKGVVLNALRTSTSAIDKFARKVLDKSNLLPRIKKVWRARAAQKADSKVGS